VTEYKHSVSQGSERPMHVIARAANYTMEEIRSRAPSRLPGESRGPEPRISAPTGMTGIAPNYVPISRKCSTKYSVS
jgi:hypothetical protein